MKTFGKMSITFLYDEESDTTVVEPSLESNKDNVSADVLQRAYIALGYHLHGMLVNKKYSDEDTHKIEAAHAELVAIMEDNK